MSQSLSVELIMTSIAFYLDLSIPKLREGSFFPSLLERRRRVDQALFAVVMEAYVHGVSTRKVDDLVKALGAESGISKSEVSRICRSEEHTSELQSRGHLVCRLLLEKKKIQYYLV